MYDGHLTAAELTNYDKPARESKHGNLMDGDIIEVHYVHSTAQVIPGSTLDYYLSDSIKNPQLRVETQVYMLVNDSNALDFMDLTKIDDKHSRQQALNIPANTGDTIQ